MIGQNNRIDIMLSKSSFCTNLDSGSVPSDQSYCQHHITQLTMNDDPKFGQLNSLAHLRRPLSRYVTAARQFLLNIIAATCKTVFKNSLNSPSASSCGRLGNFGSPQNTFSKQKRDNFGAHNPLYVFFRSSSVINSRCEKGMVVSRARGFHFFTIT